MNRIRHAYLEMVPTLRRTSRRSPYDDADSVLEVYGTAVARPARWNVGHGLTTMPGMIGVLNAAIARRSWRAIVVAVAAGSASRRCVVGWSPRTR